MDQDLTKPSPLNTDARVVRTRAALRDGLLALLEQKPLDQITIRDITAEAGAGYATFFRHYETKNALLDELIRSEIQSVIQLTLRNLQQTDSAAAARIVCAYIDKKSTLWTPLLTGGAAGAMREEFIRQSRQIASSDDAVPHWLPADLSTIFSVTATVEVLAWWLQNNKQLSVDAIATILDRLVLSQLVTKE